MSSIQTQRKKLLQVLRIYRDDSANDEKYGGKVLYESAEAVIECLSTQTSLPYENAWASLVHEVFEQYQFERELLEKHLLIYDYRPRTNFNVLPNNKEWKDLIYAPAKKHHFSVRYWSKDHSDKRAPKRKDDSIKLFVLVPIENGYRRTFQSLASLYYDLECDHVSDEYAIEFHVCVNFSDDNTLNEVLRFERTLGSCRNHSMVLYNFEDPNKFGSQGRGILWFKTLVLNTMLSHISSKFPVNQPSNLDDKVFLHFQDDDVQIDPGRGFINDNIKFLVDNSEANIVSGIYTNEEDFGFSLISSVRKRKEYISALNAGKVVNLYGGCMTTTLARLKRVLELGPQARVEFPLKEEDRDLATSEDAFLTYMSNKHLLKPTDEPAGFARPQITVRHPEEANIVSWARRLARDDRWGRQAAEIVELRSSKPGEKGVVQRKIAELRRASFNPVSVAISNSKNIAHRIADMWNYQLRILVRTGEYDFGQMAAGSVDWSTQKTQHQICKDIVNERKVFTDVLAAARRTNLGYEFVHALELCECDRSMAFPILSWMLARTNRRELDGDLYLSKYLFRWHAIAEESAGLTYQFISNLVDEPKDACAFLDLSVERAEVLSRRYPVKIEAALNQLPNDCKLHGALLKMKELRIGAGASIDRRPLWRRESYIAFYKGEKKQDLFLRYYPVFGRGRFLEASPRRRVYLQVLGEEVTRAIRQAAISNRAAAPQVELPETLYPKLPQATINYAGPEQRIPSERFAQMFYVQKKIAPWADRLWKAKLRDEQIVQVAKGLASFLAEIHVPTLGIGRHLLDGRQTSLHELQPEKRGFHQIVNLLQGHLTQIQRSDTSIYRRWLENGAYRPGAVVALLRKVEDGPGGVGGEVESLIRQEGLTLEAVWKELCKESAQSHEELGAVGHMGLYSSNIYVELNGQDHHEWDEREYRGQTVYLAKDANRVVKTIYIPNHAGVSMIDPAIEAGFVLDELISARLSSAVVGRTLKIPGFTSTGDATLTKVVTAFVSAYKETFLKLFAVTGPHFLSDGMVVEPEKLVQGIIARLSRAAAIWLLVRYHDRREYNMESDERRRLIQVCVDLLHESSSSVN